MHLGGAARRVVITSACAAGMWAFGQAPTLVRFQVMPSTAGPVAEATYNCDPVTYACVRD